MKLILWINNFLKPLLLYSTIIICITIGSGFLVYIRNRAKARAWWPWHEDWYQQNHVGSHFLQRKYGNHQSNFSQNLFFSLFCHVHGLWSECEIISLSSKSCNTHYILTSYFRYTSEITKQNKRISQNAALLKTLDQKTTAFILFKANYFQLHMSTLKIMATNREVLVLIVSV